MARKFKFKLETLLKVRKAEEDRHKRIVAERLRRIQALRSEQDDLRVNIAQALEEAAAATARRQLDVGYLARQRYWASHLQGRVLHAGVELGSQHRELDRERAALVEAATAVRVVEKLRERQRTRHDEEMDRRERLEADDLAVLRFNFLNGNASSRGSRPGDAHGRPC